jgi:hypothetical protein
MKHNTKHTDMTIKSFETNNQYTIKLTYIHTVKLTYTIQYCTMLTLTLMLTLYYSTLHYTALHYTTLHHTILHYTILHYTILYYTILYYTTLYYFLNVLKKLLVNYDRNNQLKCTLSHTFLVYNGQWESGIYTPLWPWKCQNIVLFSPQILQEYHIHHDYDTFNAPVSATWSNNTFPGTKLESLLCNIS